MKRRRINVAMTVIWTWLLLLRNWFYMKPFCFDSSVDQDKQRYRAIGINLPRGWKFLHVYLTTEGNSFNLRLLKTRSRR